MAEKVDNVIIGGGLAGLIAANLLSKYGKQVLLIEKKTYPFHRVCGEYLSHEVSDFLRREDLMPNLSLPQIDRFLYSDTQGKSTAIALDLGGFGISRFILDEFLYHRALENGAEVITGSQVENLSFANDCFSMELADGQVLEANHVIGSFGKRSKLDKALDRDFIKRRSPFIGVKYHLRTEIDRGAVALHNFPGGYCGVNAIEEDKVNVCYLGSRDQLRTYGSIEEMERVILWQNPRLKRLFTDSEFLFEKPEVINEINFEPKLPVEQHILMAGDAAGLITPLCGNGMAMAIQSGKLAAEALLNYNSRDEIENYYASNWRSLFERRLKVGRVVQTLFGSRLASRFTGNLIAHVPFLAKKIIKNTHGNPF